MLLYRLVQNHRFFDLTKPICPTIPYSRMTGEDEITPRICVARTVEDCLTSIGFLSLCYEEIERVAEDVDLPPVSTGDGSELNEMWRDLRFPFTLLTFEVAANDPSLIPPEKLENLVPDALYTGEHWITVPLKPIRIEHLWLFDASLKKETQLLLGQDATLVRVMDASWANTECPVTQNFAQNILQAMAIA